MYLHPISRNQAKGVVLQPKAQNLEQNLPRVTPELLQKYYDICLAYNMVPTPGIVYYSLSYQMGDTETYNFILNSTFILQALEENNIPIPKSAILTSFAIRKHESTAWPYIRTYYYLSNSEISITPTSVAGTSGSQDDLAFDAPNSYISGSNVVIQLPRVNVFSDDQSKAFLTTSLTSLPTSNPNVQIAFNYISAKRSLYWAGYNTELDQDFLTSKIVINPGETDINRSFDIEVAAVYQ